MVVILILEGGGVSLVLLFKALISIRVFNDIGTRYKVSNA